MTETIDFARASFLQSAPTLRLCPPDSGGEVAFAGRSNAGKSSAINTLTHQSKLARTSKTPGRTQLINFFSIGPDRRLVDLPGYGFAKVSKAIKENWDRHLAEYLQQRQSLKALVLLMDIRHPLQEYDWQMIRWATQGQLPLHILLTKADKFNHGPAVNTLHRIRTELERASIEHFSIQVFSSLKKTGLEELKGFINQWLE